jgi:SNF2 family DNA or RNA helicase
VEGFGLGLAIAEAAIVAHRGTIRAENAEGGGDWIGAEDSEEEGDEDDKNKSNLSSFVVDDEAARREKGYISANDAGQDTDEDSLLSIDAITQKMASQTLEEKPVPKHATKTEESASDSENGSEDESADNSDESEEYASDSVSDEDDWDTRRRAKNMPVVASAKIRELVKILRKEVDEHKFIVFSQFTSMLDIVEPFLEDEGFEYTRYDGSMKNDDREASLNRLRKDKNTRVLLCSLKCGSLGLNLTAATRVVIIEPFWNPVCHRISPFPLIDDTTNLVADVSIQFIEEQAIDRVHRLTQTVDVTVYKLTVKDTVEERILDLQEKKRLLAEQAIEGGMKKGALKLGLNEIIDLFKPTHHFEDAPNEVGGVGDTQQAMRDAASVMRRKPAGPKRQESEIYGRRW